MLLAEKGPGKTSSRVKCKWFSVFPRYTVMERTYMCSHSSDNSHIYSIFNRFLWFMEFWFTTFSSFYLCTTFIYISTESICENHFIFSIFVWGVFMSFWENGGKIGCEGLTTGIVCRRNYLCLFKNETYDLILSVFHPGKCQPRLS